VLSVESCLTWGASVPFKVDENICSAELLYILKKLFSFHYVFHVANCENMCNVVDSNVTGGNHCCMLTEM
jgi:hypothetical protein